jgi:L-cystine transport system permease protein
LDNFDINFAIKHIPDVLLAVPNTLLLAIVSMLLGTGFGLLVALCRTYRVPVLNQAGSVYVSFFRGTPLIVQIYLVYYGVPMIIEFMRNQLGIELPFYELPPMITALIAFTLFAGAYQAETIRSALNAIDRGQLEAAQSIGMTTRQALLRIIAPQALVSALPNFGNMFIMIIKATSLAFAVKVIEIMAVAKIAASDGYRYVEMYLVASMVYWIICVLFEQLFAWMERRTSIYERKITN